MKIIRTSNHSHRLAPDRRILRGNRKPRQGAALTCFGALLLLSIDARAASAISAVWANDGEDKVTQDELRATSSPSAVHNSVWDGATISQFGAKNEVVSFNLILEAASSAATNVNVKLSNLTGPGGAVIRSDSTRSKSNLFNWSTTEAELFYVRYLQIKGLDQFGFGLYKGSENQIPVKMRAPSAPTTGLWTSRPNHDKFYPDIAVPLELVPNFTIAASNNESIWADIYIPKTVPAGQYTGTVTITESGVITHTTPVTLTVRNFTLPDMPTSKTMLDSGFGDVSERYSGTSYPNTGSAADLLSQQAMQAQRLVAHRHKVSLVGDDGEQDGTSPSARYVHVLDGSLFTAANGYAGPGVSTGNNVYAIGMYESWTWPATQAGFWNATNSWETWFEANAASTERFVYLVDESSNFTQTQQWADWMKTNPGIGKKIPSLATVAAPDAVASVPSLSIPTSSYTCGNSPSWTSAVNAIEADSTKKMYIYQSGQPAAGSFADEAEGTSMREIPWGQYKKNVSRMFFWEATYYNDYQNGRGNNNLFHVAQTYGGVTSANANYGQLGDNSSNGNGVLFYPGTDAFFPNDSYGIAGPIASLRLKHWRRGIQDVDYLALAKAINPSATTNIINAVVPKVLWEMPCAEPTADCTYYAAGVGYSWSPNPDNWEAQRLALANIIDPGSVLGAPAFPIRILDTRAGTTTSDGLFAGIGALGSAASLALTVAGRGGVPASGAVGAVLNVTATNPTKAGYVTVWPTGSARPLASNLNVVPGQTIPNLVLAKLGSGGQISLFNAAGSTDLIADVAWYFTAASQLTALNPARVLDTRTGASTIDGQFAGGGAVAAGHALTLSLAGRGGLPASGIGSVVLNVTATNPTAASYVTVWPTGQSRPLASNLNVVPAQTIPNLVISTVSASGQVSLYNAAGSLDLIADVEGWFPAGAALTSLLPARLLDTRVGMTTVDGQFAGIGALGTANILDLTVAGRGGVPASGVGAVVLNVTAVTPTAAGYVTVWPSGYARPTASNLNFVPGQIIPNLVIALVGSNGKVSLFNSAGATNLVVDVVGWLPPGP